MKKRNKKKSAKKVSAKEQKFNKIIEDIKEIKIQGAEATAEAGIKAYTLIPEEKSAKKILATRPTEPLLQNAIKVLSKSKNPKKTSKKILTQLKKSKKKIAKEGAKLIKNDMNIFSHCHSSTVMEILKHAKKVKKKKFVVYTTEVRPLMQGRMTANELSKAGIKVVVFPDAAAEQALKKCDLFLFGVDAFTKNYVVNKIGTSMLSKIAQHYKIPRYVCGNSLKFAKRVKIEKRSGKEVWDERKKNIKVFYPVFDKTNKKFLTGVISEFGIKTYKQFIKKAKENVKKFII